MVFPDHTRLLFYVSAVDSVKQKLSGKECDKLYELCKESVIMPCLFLTVLLGWGDCGSSWSYSLTF